MERCGWGFMRCKCRINGRSSFVSIYGVVANWACVTQLSGVCSGFSCSGCEALWVLCWTSSPHDPAYNFGPWRSHNPQTAAYWHCHSQLRSLPSLWFGWRQKDLVSFSSRVRLLGLNCCSWWRAHCPEPLKLALKLWGNWRKWSEDQKRLFVRGLIGHSTLEKDNSNLT